jgi:outer membrane protein TolC
MHRFWVFILLFPTTGFAAQPPVSFPQAVEIALENNFDLRALRLQNNSLREKSRQALSPNSPTLSYMKNDLPGLDPSNTPANEQMTLSYTLGVPGKAFAQASSMRHQAEASREDAFGKEIELMAAIFNNMYGQISNQELEKILLEEIKKAGDLIKLQETRYSVGQGLQADILNARVALSRLQQDELTNRNEKLSLENQFSNLLGKAPIDCPQPLLTETHFIPERIQGLESLANVMFKSRPSLHSAELSAAAAESQVTAAELQALPDFQLSAGMNDYKISGAAPVQGLTRSYNVGITVTLPLFFPINELTGIRAAKADLETARAKSELGRASARIDLITNYTNFTSSQFSIDQMIKVVIPAARASYELTLSTYARGKSDYLRLADARGTFIQACSKLLPVDSDGRLRFYKSGWSPCMPLKFFPAYCCLTSLLAFMPIPRLRPL